MPLFLLARIAGERVAVPAAAVGTVIEVGAITPVPRAPPHVAGLCALRSRVLTVVDAAAALGLGRVAAPDALAVVVEHAGHGYALLVDEVEDVVEAPPPRPCPAAMAPCWARVADGVVDHDGATLLATDPAALIDGAGAANGSVIALA